MAKVISTSITRNMSREDIVYMLLLFGAIPLGHLIKVSGSPARKQFLALIAGLGTVLATSGLGGIPHSFFTILGTYIILKILGARYCHSLDILKMI